VARNGKVERKKYDEREKEEGKEDRRVQKPNV
jgi:hypothetical protein